MRTRRSLPWRLLGAVVLAGTPSCICAHVDFGRLARSEGRVEALATVTHVVPATRSDAQVIVDVAWTDPEATLTVYVTSAACTGTPVFVAPDRQPSAPCEAGHGWDGTATRVRTGRRGGEPLKIFIVGDARRAQEYTLDVTWEVGGECL